MVNLKSIRNYVERLAYITAVVLDMDVLICNTDNQIIGDSEHMGDGCIEIEHLRNDSVLSKTMSERRTLIYNNAKVENKGCINCIKKNFCKTETIITYPLIKDDIVYGAIGIYSQQQRQKIKLIEEQNLLMQFIGEMGQLILLKIEDETRSKLIATENLRMNSIIETLDFALISFDENDNILYSNHLMNEIIRAGKRTDIIHTLLELGDIKEGSSMRKETRIYIKEKGENIEYEMTYIPIIVDSFFRGAQIYLKEAKQMIEKANKLLEPIISGTFNDIIGDSEAIIKVKKDAIAFADSCSNLLIQGESGTGKEVFASAIHNAGQRATGPFVAVNCAAIPDNLLESELFGYVKGAFTGAAKEGRAGKFEVANGGTLFLDEIGELPIHLQPKLLRALQEKKIQRVGSNRWIDIDIRIIAATNRNLTEMVKNGTFREDLYYRLCVIPIKIPPLRERKEDITLLADYFLKMYKSMLNKEKIKGFDKSVIQLMKKYLWKGNVRELQNTIEYAVNRCSGTTIQIDDLPDRILNAIEEKVRKPQKLSELEKTEISNALKYFKGTIDAKEKAAFSLGISRATMYRKIKEYNL